MFRPRMTVFRIPQYLLWVVESYLYDRKFKYDTVKGPCRKRSQPKLSKAQLWLLTSGMFMPTDIFLVTYVDEIIAVILILNTEDAQREP